MKFKIGITLAVVAFLGFLDSAYLTMEHYLHAIPPCTILHGCEAVTTSSYSLMFGVPLALLGVIYYLFIFAGSVFALERKNEKVLRIISSTTIIGFIFSLYFLYLQSFVIHAFCIYCLFSVLTSTTLFILGLYNLYSPRKSIE